MIGKVQRLWAFGVVMALSWSGCAEAPGSKVSGLIVQGQSGLQVGALAPDVMFVDGAGKLTRLSSLYEDSTVIAIVEGDCTVPVPELNRAADEVGPGVRIVEIFKACREDDDDCLKTLEGKGSRIVSLCDGHEILSRRYGVSEGNVVFVLDAWGRVVERGSLSDLAALTRKASSTAVAVADTRARLYGGN